MKNGIVRRVTGPVVDVQFPAGHLPDIYNAIEIQLEDRKVVMEAMQQLGSDTVRCVSLFSTDGIARGCTAVDTGSPVTMPVGEATLGRMFNVVGDPIDGKGPVEAERMPIHRSAPSFTDVTPSTEILETGIKWTCWPHIPRAARSACSAAPAWVKRCLFRSLYATWPTSTAATPCLPAWVSALVRATTCGMR